jgi:hypothetical protein
MNRKNLAATVFAVATAAVAGQAFAETPNAVPQDSFVPSKARTEVQAELSQYKAAGVNPWSTSYNPLRSFKSTASRDQVTAAYIASRDEVAALNGEGSGSTHPAQAQRALDAGTTLAGQAANTAR